MRKSLWIVLAVMVVALGAPNAHADTYAISFAGGPTVVGSDLLDFDTTTSTFTTPSFEISFGGLDLTLTNVGLPVSPTDDFVWQTLGGGGLFEILDSTNHTETYFVVCPGLTPCPFGLDAVTLTPVTNAPEPASLLLLGSGLLGLAGIKRRRIGC